MIKYLTPIAAIFLLSAGIANAKVIKNSNQAVTVCKSYLKENVQGHKRSNLNKVRGQRGNFLVQFAVTTEEGRTNTKCLVNRDDGSVTLKN